MPRSHVSIKTPPRDIPSTLGEWTIEGVLDETHLSASRGCFRTQVRGVEAAFSCLRQRRSAHRPSHLLNEWVPGFSGAVPVILVSIANCVRHQPVESYPI